jgi:tRNA-specific 2-thiouridylase
MSKKGKVLVGISGGVDSSVAALLLKNQGYEVHGVFVKVWQPDFIECNWRDEKRDAMRICAQLEIPFHFLDLEKEYKEEVVDYMLDEYKKGRTPNPDIMCNKYIKFGHLFDYAQKNEFDFVATGHYARTENGKLFRGKDSNKDQSYFLWTLTQDKLKKILFPIGDLHKDKVRKIAEENNLASAKKKDSQGVCILGPINIKDFLKKYIDVKRGDLLDEEGEVIGAHEGAVLYTIGERHGFKIDQEHKTTSDQTLYVIGKDVKENTITVSSTRNIGKQECRKIEIKNQSFVTPEKAGVQALDVEFQTRYRQKPQRGILNKDVLEADFEELPAIGQSVVFYKGDECLGGGVIDKLV